jgi:hypothetical protein
VSKQVNSSVIYFQQGDVLLKLVSKEPIGLKALATDAPKVLQHGETTGHKHQFDAGAAVQLLFDPSDVPAETLGRRDLRITDLGQYKRYVRLESPALLRHEEHLPVEVPAGLYELDIVREYSYDEMEVRRVVD